MTDDDHETSEERFERLACEGMAQARVRADAREAQQQAAHAREHAEVCEATVFAAAYAGGIDATKAVEAWRRFREEASDE